MDLVDATRMIKLAEVATPLVVCPEGVRTHQDDAAWWALHSLALVVGDIVAEKIVMFEQVEAALPCMSASTARRLPWYVPHPEENRRDPRRRGGPQGVP